MFSAVAILGYGNQGRAHALNLRDSGVTVTVGARPGKGFDQAVEDGFSPVAFETAVDAAPVVVFLLPDQIIPGVYGALHSKLSGKSIGFAHGFALHFGFVERLPDTEYFLVGPKGAGAILREKYLNGEGLPGVYVGGDLAKVYACAIGLRDLVPTTFQEETECDLFGEQVVLCGGIFELMQQAYEVLVEKGHSPEMAFLECCFEARLITQLWMDNGPKGVTQRISPTAFYGGLTRGKRLVTPETRREMEKIFDEIRDGSFAKEWMREAEAGMPKLVEAHDDEGRSSLQAVFDRMRRIVTPPKI